MISKGTIAIVGQGYVGLPLAMAACKAGWKVIGFDTDLGKIENLRQGRSLVEDVHDSTIKLYLEAGLYVPVSDASAISECSIAIVCVPTPLSEEGLPDLSFVSSAVETIAMFAKDKLLLINESTSYPGTLRELIPQIVNRTNPSLKLLYAVAPERIDPGNTDWGYAQTPRVVGGLDREALERTMEFYKTICEVVIPVDSPEIAEMSKLLENSYRQVNIALVNEMVPLCQKLGISFFDVAQAANTKPYGFSVFLPGVGVGGHCIPVDPIYLAWTARNHGTALTLIEKSQEINKAMPSFVAEIVRQECSSFDTRILIVGLSYKKGVRDLRESPAVELFRLLSSDYHNLEWWDNGIEKFLETKRSHLKGKFDLVVITQRIELDLIEDIVANSNLCLDLTGMYRTYPNVKSF